MKIPCLSSVGLSFVCLGVLALPAAAQSAKQQAYANNIILPNPKVDGEGYFPGAPKVFYISGPNATPGAPFNVQDEAGHIVYGDDLSQTPVDDAAAAETVLSGDFSSLRAPGTYRVVVGSQVSPPFHISVDPYRSLFHDAARTLSLIRCGVAIDDPITGLKHPACHTGDVRVRGQTQRSDFTGGWHNAGDYGKWTHEAAIASSLLLWLYTLGPEEARGEKLDIGEARPDMPDLLSEARWGLSWLLKMQRPDGSVFHKVDSEPNFAWGMPPQDDPTSRTAADPSTIDAADFTAVMAQAAQVLSRIDPDFARTCGAAADKSWKWVQANPSIGQTDPYYTDADPSQEVFWAECEMAVRTRDADVISAIHHKLAGAAPNALGWSTPDPLGWLAIAHDPHLPVDLRSLARAGLAASAAAYEKTAAAAGYGVALQPQDYSWESNESLLGRTCLMLFAFTVGDSVRDRLCAVEQMHYLLGRNSLGKSFITSHGSDPIRNPYHWSWFDFHDLIPGWATGGPNQYTDGADQPLVHLIGEGTPPAKCYLDRCASDGSWASNEGELVEEAELIFVTGMLTGTH